MVYSRTASYNAKGQLLSDDVSAWRNNDVYRTLSNYSYGTGASYALGAVTQIDAQNWKDGAVWPATRTINAYDWYDGAVTGSVSFDPDANAAGTINVSTYANALIGGEAQLASVDVADGRPRTIAFRSDMLGQVFRRDEKDNLSSGDPHEVWHRYSGRQMGYVGNNGKADVDYASSVAEKQSPPGQSSFADFDLAYDAINAYEQGGRGGVYTVQAGDTLAGIASQLWGDASLWWKLAEINGLTAESTLVEGVLLIVPVGVQTNANNAATFQPYDPLEVLGNTSPTSPKPSHNKTCGGMGQVLLAVIAIAVTIATQGALAQATSGVLKVIGSNAIATGATSAAAGSVASQAVGVATGIQDRFSWNAVALSAIGGGVGGGIGLQSPSGWGQAAVNATAQNIITQGIGVATGLQDKFSWAGVAAAGVGGAIGHAVGKAVGATSLMSTPTAANFGANLVRSGAQVVADAATRTLIDGSDFGDNVIAALPTALGSLVGEAMMGSAASDWEAQFHGLEAEGSGDGRHTAWWRERTEALRDGRYSPTTQLEDWEYDGAIVYVDALTTEGTVRRAIAFPDAGRDLEAFIREWDPEFQSTYREPSTAQAGIVRVLERSPNSAGNMHYSEGYVSYLAQYAADLYDFGALSRTPLRPPPLYERTSVAGTGITVLAGDGNEAMIALAPGGRNAPSRAGMVRSSGSGTIGRSGYANWSAFASALEGEYQRAYNDAQARWQNMTPQERRDATGNVPENLREGRFHDRFANEAALAFVQREGLREGRGERIRIDRALRNPRNWLQTVRPDIHVVGTYLGDGGVGSRTLDSRRGQVRNAMSWSGLNRFTVIRPEARGGSFTLLGPGYTGASPPPPPPVTPTSPRPRR